MHTVGIWVYNTNKSATLQHPWATRNVPTWPFREYAKMLTADKHTHNMFYVLAQHVPAQGIFPLIWMLEILLSVTLCNLTTVNFSGVLRLHLAIPKYETSPFSDFLTLSSKSRYCMCTIMLMLMWLVWGSVGTVSVYEPICQIHHPAPTKIVIGRHVQYAYWNTIAI